MDGLRFTPAHPTDQRASIRFLHAFNRVFCDGFHQLRVHAPCTLPDRGPGILVCNHISHLDPMLLQAACQRMIMWMMTRDFYDMPVMGRLFRHLEAIPVSPTGRDTTAMRMAMRALEDGRIIGIFPEGGIARNGQLRPFQTGVALMAMKTGVPVYPAAVEATSRNTTFLQAVLSPQEAHVAFGPPIHLTRHDHERADLDAATARIREQIEHLLGHIDRARRS